ncbi:membrane protein YczE [Myceligenerans halotolerans]
MTERTTLPGPPRAAETGAWAGTPRFGPVRRATQLVLGLGLFTFSMAMIIHSGQGNTPWDVLHEGLVQVTGLSFGWIVLIVSVAVLACWIPLRQRPGIGTIANALIISLAIDPSLALLDRLAPDPGLLAAVLLALSGIVLNGVATAAYIGVRLGPGTRDGLMTGLVGRTGWPVWRIRTGIETVVVITGILLGGTFGWSTVLFALAIGPVVQWSSWKWLAPRGLVG